MLDTFANGFRRLSSLLTVFSLLAMMTKFAVGGKKVTYLYFQLELSANLNCNFQSEIQTMNGRSFRVLFYIVQFAVEVLTS